MYREFVYPNISTESGKALLFHQMGRVKYLLKNYKEASKDFMVAVEVVPNHSIYNYNLGVALIKAGEDGCEYINKGKELGLYGWDEVVVKEDTVFCED